MLGILTFCSWSQWIGARPHGGASASPHSPTIAQITLSSVNLSLSLSEVDCFHALHNKTLLQSFNDFMLPKQVCTSFKINVHTLHTFLSYLIFYYSYFMNSWNHKGILHWKWIPVFLFYQSQLIKNTETLLYFISSQHVHCLAAGNALQIKRTQERWHIYSRRLDNTFMLDINALLLHYCLNYNN